MPPRHSRSVQPWTICLLLSPFSALFHHCRLTLYFCGDDHIDSLCDVENRGMHQRSKFVLPTAQPTCLHFLGCGSLHQTAVRVRYYFTWQLNAISINKTNHVPCTHTHTPSILHPHKSREIIQEGLVEKNQIVYTYIQVYSRVCVSKIDKFT